MILDLDKKLPDLSKIDCQNLILRFRWKNDEYTYLTYDKIKDCDSWALDNLGFLEFNKRTTQKGFFKDTTHNETMHSVHFFPDETKLNTKLILENFATLKHTFW